MHGDSDSTLPDDPDVDKDYNPSDSSSTQSDGDGNETQNNNITENNLLKRRKRNEAGWKRNLKKHKRNSGYGKQFVNTQCSCNKKCHEKILEEQREMCFKSFWKLENYSKQNSYICGLVKRAAVKQRRKRDGSRGEKGCTNKYFLTINNESLNVCKQYFLATFQLSDGRMTRALKKEQHGLVGEDLRGKSASVNKTSEIKITEVKNHIHSFPAYTSHYTRQNNPNRRYLDSGLNVRKMYNLYKICCEENNTHPVSENIYRGIFYEENLHFHAPLKDTCQLCDRLKLKIEVSEGKEKDDLKTQHELHLRKAEKARQAMKDDGELKPEDGYHVISFDLQKALAFPNLTTSVAYYKRNLYCYNLGVHNLQTNKANMYVWDETTASRGSQEVASCLSVHFANEAVGRKHIVMFSDSCTGQNRNIKLALTLMKIVMDLTNEISVIDHKFLVSGHSYLKNDSDFGNIEKSAKNRVHYVPSDWYETIRTARTKNRFVVHVMEQEEFKSTQQLEKAVIRKKKNLTGMPVNWLKIQWIRFTNETPHTMFYKTTLNRDVEFEKLILPPMKQNQQSLVNIRQRRLFNVPRPITEAKKKDLHDLLPFIPPVHHQFFTALKTSEEVADIGPLEHIEENIDNVE